MKLHILAICALTGLFMQGAFAMQQQAPRGEFVAKGLIIENQYPDQIAVSYIREEADAPEQVITFKLQHGETSLNIEDVNTLKDLRFEAYGRIKGYLNFANSENYRIKFNNLVWEKTPYPAVLHITVAGEQVVEPQTTIPIPAAEQNAAAGEAAQKGWGALAWHLGSSALQRAQEAVYYGVQKSAETVMPRLLAFKVTAKIEPKKKAVQISEAYESRKILGQPLTEKFLAAKGRINNYGYFLGRDILGLGEKYTVGTANENKRLLKEHWENELKLYANDPEAAITINAVLKLIEEAGIDPERVFPKERLI